jgi:prepilin-type N-terminal cleavage/methylation domain-containing protein
MLGTYQRIKLQRAAGEIEEGFTLIELLIVIVVLGILAAVTVFALSGTTAKSSQAACDADAQTVNSALQAYNVQNPNTPATMSLLVSGSYLQSLPANSSHYTIGLNSAGTSVTVGSGNPLVTANYPGTPDPCQAASVK